MKKYFATANSIGKAEYGLEAGKLYKVEQGNYGTLVYDIFDNFVTEARTDAFDNYKEIK